MGGSGGATGLHACSPHGSAPRCRRGKIVPRGKWAGHAARCYRSCCRLPGSPRRRAGHTGRNTSEATWSATRTTGSGGHWGDRCGQLRGHGEALDDAPRTLRPRHMVAGAAAVAVVAGLITIGTAPFSPPTESTSPLTLTQAWIHDLNDAPCGVAEASPVEAHSLSRAPQWSWVIEPVRCTPSGCRTDRCRQTGRARRCRPPSGPVRRVASPGTTVPPHRRRSE